VELMARFWQLPMIEFKKKRRGERMNKMTYRISIGIYMIIMLVALAMVPANANEVEKVKPVKVTVDGQVVSFSDQEPYIDSASRTMVPVRAPMEAMGCVVSWDENAQQAIIKKDNTTAIFTINNQSYTINNKAKTMDTKAVIVNDRTAFPIRFAAEAMGATVGWDKDTYTVIITTKNPEIPPIVTPPVTTETISGTPFYQLDNEKVETSKKATMPSSISKNFEQTSDYGKESSFLLKDSVLKKLPYKFYTDKSLVYLMFGQPVFRGYIDMNDGKGLQMVDLRVGTTAIAIMKVGTQERLELVEW
jgi:hypothetical protein